jgi:hypothetical protein
MMHRQYAVVVVLAALISSPALAQFDVIDQSKLYVSDPEACAAIEAQGFAGVGEGLALSFEDGIQAYEFHCQFFDVKSKDNSPFLLVEAVCEEPGIRSPDLLSISPFEENTIEVVSLHDSLGIEASEDNPTPGTIHYTRCDNLSGIPR